MFAMLGSLALPPLAAISSARSLGGHLSPSAEIKITVYCLVAAGVFAGFVSLLGRLASRLAQESGEQASFLDSLPSTFLPLATPAVAGLSLFLELAVIRWQASVFEFFAFYKNFSLLGCFAGLGIGYAMSRNREGVPLCLAIPLLAWQFSLLIFLRRGMPYGQSYSLQMIPFREQLNMGLPQIKSVQFVAIYLLLTVVFILTVLAFLPIGQLCGRLMERTRQLKAYGLNLLGSVLGVSLIFFISYFWAPPLVWFGISFLVLIFFVVRNQKSLLFAVTATLLALLILAWPVNPLWHSVYSPYQVLEIAYGERGLLMIRAAGHYYQQARDLSNAAVERSAEPKLARIRNYYELPFRIAHNPGEVAIVGAGSGNDVAAALRREAQHVDAIEIDPAILQFGRSYHPERPYDDPRVSGVVNDARSFFRNATKRYDVVVYGLLDSHTLLSHASSVRIDSFVYTVEGLREARSLLKDEGVLSLSFSVINDALGTKIYKMMQEAFDGKEPVCIYAEYDGSVMFVQAKNGDLAIPPKLLAESGFDDRTALYRRSAIPVDVSIDDWPFFYMPRRVYPLSYLPMLGLVVLLSLVFYRRFFNERPQVSHAPFFFLGTAFMLVETKAITELGLTFGNTWEVIGISIASILTMSYLSNSVVQWLRSRNSFWPHLLVLASLLAGWWIARAGGLPSTSLGRLGTAFLLTCPVFFSGMVFSSLLFGEANISIVMAVNLLGAMIGGILEYNSMYFGFHFLYLLAMGLYGMSFLSTLISRSSAVVPVPAD
jgi:SAM-dependent methyltransferase